MHDTLVHDVTVIAPERVLDELATRELIDALLRHSGDEVIVDIRAIEPLPTSLVGLLLAGRDRPDTCCVVCRGAGPDGVARFASVGDALQDRALARCGYGGGWAVA